LGAVKTTVDIPDDELSALMKWTGAKTKRDAIVAAVVDYNRRARSAAVAQRLGTFDGFATPAELRRARKAG
jgi:hypothetical protein